MAALVECAHHNRGKFQLRQGSNPVDDTFSGWLVAVSESADFSNASTSNARCFLFTLPLSRACSTSILRNAGSLYKGYPSKHATIIR